MKITIEVDCTPEEARTFMGLPDLTDVQKAASDALMEQLKSSLGSLDSEGLMKTWFSGDLKGWEQMQKNFWATAGVKAPGDTKK